MGQLGSGLDTSFPSVIDTYQTFRNGTPAAPDSDTRLDAELMMDVLKALISVETTLGTNPQGIFGSVSARLNALESGGAALTNVVAFTSQTTVNLPGTAHQQGQQALLYQVYDDATPRQAIIPDSFSVFPTSFDAVVTFPVAQSGVVMVAALTPQYVTTFTNQTTLVIPGTTHALAQTYLFFQVFDTATPAHAIDVGGLSVHPTTKDVTVTFAAPQSGTLVLSVGSPRYAQAFTNQTSVTVLGTAHGLASADLLWEVYDASASPTVIQPGSLSVHPTTFDVALTFAAPQSGTLLLAPVPSVTPILLSVLPLAQAVPVVIATRPAPLTPELEAVQLRSTVATLDDRLQTLEAAYQTLLAQLGSSTQEEPSA